MQILGDGSGDDIHAAFQHLKKHQPYLLASGFKNVIAVEYKGEFINNLEL